MKSLAQQIVSVPSYMLDFQCQMCGECCGGWKISVEKKLYKELKNLFVTKRISKGNFMDFFQREDHPKMGGEIDYGLIKLSDEGRCKLQEGNLCFIHKDVGPEYLPGICKVFPRVIISTLKGLEFSLTPGCKSAARAFLCKSKAQVIVNPPGFEFIPGSTVWDYVTRERISKNEITKYYDTMEDHFIEIIQNRSWSIEERIIFLGLTINKILNLPQDENFKPELDKLLESDKDIMAGNAFSEEVRKLGLNMDYQLIALKNFLNSELYKNCADPEVIHNVSKCAKKILSGEMTENINTYRKMYHYHMRPGAKEIAHVFENYLVNFVLRKTFILYTLEDAFYILAFFYIIIRVVTISLASEKNEVVREEDVVKAIYLIEKSLGHNRAYNEVLAQFKPQNLTDTVHAIALVRI